MDLETAEFLVSPRGRDAMALLEGVDVETAPTLALLESLRRSLPGEVAGGLLTLARLRRRAEGKFPQAERLFFVPEALEQATAWEIAGHRAAWIHAYAPSGAVLDLGCGVGGDTLALAQLRPVIAYETDPVRLCFARANARALGLERRVRFVPADWTAEAGTDRLPEAAAAFADPARRSGETRLFRLNELIPPLSHMLRLQAQIPALGVKVMPGVQEEELPEGCSVEFIGHEGRCKEAVLWFGPLQGPHGPGRRWASVHTDRGWREIPAGGARAPVGALEAGMVLHEPHNAVIRAGALAELCRELGAHLFDPRIAYLVGGAVTSHPLTQSFRILEIHGSSLKQLNRRIQALDLGRVELKKRGAPAEPERLRPRIRTTGSDRPGVIIFTRRTRGSRDEHLTLICQRISLRSGEAL